jgi:HD-like signal output (HDOD) protein
MTGTVSLLEQINTFVAGENFRLPVFNETALRLQQIARDDNYDIREIERVILCDQVLTSEVLRTANSPFFGGLTVISTINDAVVRLGSQQVADIVMLACEQSRYRADDPELKAIVRKLWSHAVACGMGSQWLARKLDFTDVINEAFIGGLLHDIGKLYLLLVLDAIKASTDGDIDFPRDLVMELLDTVHAEKGYMILKEWNLPHVYCNIAQNHHVDECDSSDIPLLLVRLADQTCVKLGIGPRYDPSIILAEAQEAHNLGAKDLLLAQLQIMLEDTLHLSEQHPCCLGHTL